jgi:hypothetical protein
VVLATDDFERLARFQARAMGFLQLKLVIVPHPLGGIPAEDALKKAPPLLDIIAGMFNA